MMYGGKTVDRIYDQVRRLGEYEITGPIRINAADFGVPQNRERIVFVGNRRDMSQISGFPVFKNRTVTVREAISDLAFLRPWEKAADYHPDYAAETAYQDESRIGRWSKIIIPSTSSGGLRNHEAAKHTPDVIARFAMIQQGGGFDSIPKELWDKHLSSSKKWCVKLDPDKPAFTVVTLPDDFVHYEQPRILTVREMARLQSFDDTFEFLGPRASGGGGKGNKKRNKELPQYSQVGNAVPPLMARALGNVLLRCLQEQAKSTHPDALSSRLHRPVPQSDWATA
jgi:DNA (cytosine-5)-methyltransferase 1